MQELIAKGITLTESIVLWPFKTAQVLAKRSPGLREALHIAEDLVDIPFNRAKKLMGNRDAIRQTGDAGPALRNIFINPEVTIISDLPLGEKRRVIMRVTGLLCEA